MFCYWCQGLPGNQQEWQIVTQKMQSSNPLSNLNLLLHICFFFFSLSRTFNYLLSFPHFIPLM